MASRSFKTVGGPVDLAATLAPLRRGHRDPVLRIAGREAVLGVRTREGSAALWLRAEGQRVEAEAWGSGASAALDSAPDLIGAHDAAEGFAPLAEPISGLWRRHRGIRLTRTVAVLPVLVAAILEQKVTGMEAVAAWRSLAHAASERAPGPAEVWLPPDAERLAALPSFSFHRAGVERRRADTIRAVASRAPWFEALVDLSPSEAQTRIQLHRGIGPWTAAEVARLAMGDPDAVSVCDFHLPNLVAWAMAGEPRADDARMLELLEPYRGHRARVQVLLEAGGGHAPRFGPRTPIRSIAGV